MNIKNYLSLLILIFFFTECAFLRNATSRTFKDKRDGQTYKWVRLKDGKKWMAQNLNYEMADSWCFDNEDSNCALYGRLYTWKAVMKACPEGWRLPTDDEWWKMASYYGKADNPWEGQEINRVGDAGKEAYKALMLGGNSGFSALLGGNRDPDGFDYFYYFGDHGDYWSSTENSSSDAWLYYFDGSDNKRLYRYLDNKSMGFSCRCLQD